MTNFKEIIRFIDDEIDLQKPFDESISHATASAIIKQVFASTQHQDSQDLPSRTLTTSMKRQILIQIVKVPGSSSKYQSVTKVSLQVKVLIFDQVKG